MDRMSLQAETKGSSSGQTHLTISLPLPSFTRWMQKCGVCHTRSPKNCDCLGRAVEGRALFACQNQIEPLGCGHGDSSFCLTLTVPWRLLMSVERDPGKLVKINSLMSLRKDPGDTLPRELYNAEMGRV